MQRISLRVDHRMYHNFNGGKLCYLIGRKCCWALHSYNYLLCSVNKLYSKLKKYLNDRQKVKKIFILKYVLTILVWSVRHWNYATKLRIAYKVLFVKHQCFLKLFFFYLSSQYNEGLCVKSHRLYQKHLADDSADKLAVGCSVYKCVQRRCTPHW